MELRSTSDPKLRATWKDAVLAGLAPDGGLYLPTQLPFISPDEIKSLSTLPFSEFAYNLAQCFLGTEVPAEDLRRICKDAFDFPCPTLQLDSHTHILELFHGPTCAFKDFGARFMARLFRYFWGDNDRPLTVIVATSGDTGSAVANAFFDSGPNPSIRVAILFPKDRVSEVQRKQMTTLGHNVTAIEVAGTFDDCQSLAKQALRDTHMADNTTLTSANSINIARLLPQMFYYAYTSARLSPSDGVTYSVPSGNLGNLTGGLLAHLCGFNTKRLIAACNANRTFPDFIATGAFSPTSSFETTSNAMDVGNPSNFSRIISLYNHNLDSIRSTISSYSIDDTETRSTMKKVYSQYGYVLDPHTAVGVAALLKERNNSSDEGINCVLATAHPAKFSRVVEDALGIIPTAPRQLLESLAKTENLVPISTRYEELKEFLGR